MKGATFRTLSSAYTVACMSFPNTTDSRVLDLVAEQHLRDANRELDR